MPAMTAAERIVARVFMLTSLGVRRHDWCDYNERRKRGFRTASSHIFGRFFGRCPRFRDASDMAEAIWLESSFQAHYLGPGRTKWSISMNTAAVRNAAD